MKKLSDLVAMTAVEKVEGPADVEILDVTADSRKVEKGSLFICLCGAHVDGHDFVDAAVKKGAAAIVASKEISVPASVAVVYVKDTRKAMEDMVPFSLIIPPAKCG